MLAKPPILKGQGVQLEPLTIEHADELGKAVTDGKLWELWFTTAPHPDAVEAYIDKALTMVEQGTALAFVVRNCATDEIIGSTRICNWDKANRRMEIGYTWYAKRYWRTHVNTESKLLLLGHCFDRLGAIAVELRTHWHNHRSREAIAKLGAKQDGILRNHKIGVDGVIRDTVVFSILNTEWPSVKHNLSFKLQRHG